MIRVTLLPPRCYVFGRHIHHGLIGMLLMLHDRRDWRCWLPDLVWHPRRGSQ